MTHSIKRNRQTARWLFTLVLIAGVIGQVARLSAQQCGATNPCKNSVVKSITIVEQNGARPRFSPDGAHFVFDQYNADGFADVYVANLDGSISTSITSGRAGIGQRNNGNAAFDPSGQFVVFASEAPVHIAAPPSFTDPGVGGFANMWAADINGTHFWQLTSNPIKQTANDGIPYLAVVNPLFSADGKTFVWTERFGDTGSDPWGKWQIMGADYAVQNGVPSIANIRTIYTPAVVKQLTSTSSAGNYTTAMGYLSPNVLLVAGNQNINLAGNTSPDQGEYGMDQYSLDITKQQVIKNFTNTIDRWEEGSSVAPNNQFIYMSNKDSAYNFNPADTNWENQPTTREWYITDNQAIQVDRLTYFNDPTAGEYSGNLINSVSMSVRSDGKYVVGTIGVAPPSNPGVKTLQCVLLELNSQLLVASVNGASFAPISGTPDAIISLFSPNLANGQNFYTPGQPLPKQLGGVTVTIVDSQGVSHAAPLFYAGPTQVDYLVADSDHPSSTVALGPATVIVQNPAGVQTQGKLQIDAVGPGLFSANANGSGPAAGQWVDVAPTGAQTEHPLFTCPPGGACVTSPIVYSSPSDTVVLVLYGTGLRAAGLAAISATVGGKSAQVAFAGAQPQYAGEDQINISVPGGLAGAGVVNVVLTVSGQNTNTVQVQFQ